MHLNLKLSEEGKTLFQYLTDSDLLENKIFKKLSNNPLTQNEFEIFLYSLRFIFNTSYLNKKCFYNLILTNNSKNEINSNFIPGSFSRINEYEKSYDLLMKKLLNSTNDGFYICKDCGYLYLISFPSFPIETSKCPKGHTIGGTNNINFKKDLRIFETNKDYSKFVSYWKQPTWIESFQAVLLNDFKDNYVDKNKTQIDKGIIKDYELYDFVNISFIRNMHKITYRFLNYILYSYLLISYLLGNLTDDTKKEYLIKGLIPNNLFAIVKKNWELLSISLKEKGIENVQIFINTIFEKIIELMSNFNSFDTVDKMFEFEKEVNNYILEKIKGKKEVEQLNNEYHKLNDKIKQSSPYCYKEMIIANYDPSIYNQDNYPDIQYYSVSIFDNIDTFIKKFKSSEENKTKYVLINALLDENSINNLKHLKYLNNINRLSNLLLSKYNFKIKREESKKIIFSTELESITNYYNKMYNLNLTLKEFKKNIIQPFLESWDKIKVESTQYGVRVLRDLEYGEKPLDMNENLSLYYFLVDDGDKGGGMFLASAYEHMIRWQNNFLNIIINNNKYNGPLNKYVSQLEQKIDIQDATNDEIINIDDNTYQEFKNLILKTSMRNIYINNNKINYQNYNDITYDFDYLEEELGKIILSKKKGFTQIIYFVKYLYEGFIGSNAIILSNYLMNYGKRKLIEKEEKIIFDMIKENNNIQFYIEIYNNLQILIDKIIEENYNPLKSIYKIISSLPPYTYINEKLKKILQENDLVDEKLFSINCLISIFEIFEALCWNEIKNNISIDYKLILEGETIKKIIKYFEDNNNKQKIVNKINFTSALRKLISRYLVGIRQEVDYRTETQLIFIIIKEDIWDKNIIDNDDFDNELNEILNKDIVIGQAFDLYNKLEGDLLLNSYIEEKIFGEIKSQDNERQNDEISNEVILVDKSNDESNEDEFDEDDLEI